jgi:hypothetical protein
LTAISRTTRGEDVHVPPAAGAGAGQDDPAGLVRADQGDFLGDEPAEREAEQVIPPEPESVCERDGVQCHRLHGARRGSGGGGDASVVQEDDFSLPGNRVDHERIPVVEVGPEVHEEHERQRGGLGVPKAPVGIGDPVRGLDPQVRRGGLASVTGHLVDLGVMIPHSIRWSDGVVQLHLGGWSHSELRPTLAQASEPAAA